MSGRSPIILRMQGMIQQWEAVLDDRALFLNCYMRMTANMLDSIERREFQDNIWVDRLLHHFADYYFNALDGFDRKDDRAPAVWTDTLQQTAGVDLLPLQKLLLGVNAHINYDLVLSLYDLLAPEWNHLNAEQRRRRYADHGYVNAVIGTTIDAVQDEILEPSMPVMRYIDALMGPVDEYLISRLISNWRETVWQHTIGLLACNCAEDRTQRVKHVENEALKTARIISRL